ncbi:hypothetical protein ACFV9D_22570 [Streptomyces sp. NPDC059875]|uniref:hypothetical protein n=1 Tax=unclassified Streptomyces TaxID=2593676 RepID=UPI003649C932
MTRLDERLVGHWSSTPFDVGAMETSALGFLPDGRGWSRFESITSELSIGRFRWHCPTPGVLEIRYTLRTGGTWDVATGGFATVNDSGPDDEVIRTGYRIGPETPPYAEEPLTTLQLDTSVEFALHFARGHRDIRTIDDVSAAVVPYEAP